MILLDTNAVIWATLKHRRARPLSRLSAAYVSPATALELQLLIELGRITLAARVTVSDILAAGRWLVDDPPAAKWFEEARSIGWTRDPFDRLIVSHARLRRWRLATGDHRLIDALGTDRVLPL
jgi:PIN domain nuclease of toxin-antitoxin system